MNHSDSDKLTEDRALSILRAAFDVFSEAGFIAARMEHIAARAGVTKGLIYFYYKNKQELFKAVLEEYVKKPFHHLLLDVNPAKSMASHLARLLEELYSNMAESPFFPKLVRLILLEPQRLPGIHENYYQEVILPVVNIIRQCLDEGARRGEWSAQAIPVFPQPLIAPLLIFMLWNMNFSHYEHLNTTMYCNEHQKMLLRSLGLNDQAVAEALFIAKIDYGKNTCCPCKTVPVPNKDCNHATGETRDEKANQARDKTACVRSKNVAPGEVFDKIVSQTVHEGIRTEKSPFRSGTSGARARAARRHRPSI